MKIFLIILFTSLLTGCFESNSPKETISDSSKENNVFDKMRFDGAYILLENGKLIELLNQKEDSEKPCKIDDYACERSGITYGFKREFFSSTVTEEEFVNARVFIRMSEANFDLKLGKANVLYKKHIMSGEAYGEPLWITHYCFNTRNRRLTCPDSSSGFKSEITTFRRTKIKDTLFEVKTAKPLKEGHYFFWFQTSKQNGFTEGYPFSIENQS